MTWPLLLRCGGGAVWAVAAIAWWGRECRCQTLIAYEGPDCCKQCTSGWIYFSGSKFYVGHAQHMCTNAANMYCDPNNIRVPLGSYANPTSCAEVLPCNVGHYCTETLQRPCPAGTINYLTGQSSCTGCPPGQFQSLEGQSSCTACSDCYPGDYVTGACGGSSNRQCGSCFSGRTFSTSMNAAGCTGCSTCRAGQVQTGPCSYTHDIVCRDRVGSCCEQCRDGYMYNNGAFRTPYVNCNYYCGGNLCNAGAYAETGSCSYCDTCGPGTYCVADTSTPCSAGTFSSNWGQTICTGCNVGVDYAAGLGNTGCTACTVCQPGTRVRLDATASTDRQCEPCSGTWTSTTTNAAVCDVCIAGYWKRSSACETCRCSGETYVNCPVGSNRQTCTACTGSAAAGYCAVGTEPSLTCDGTQTQDTSCRVCPAGKEKLSTSVRDCNKCPTGKYKDGDNTNACVDCTNKESHTYPSGTVYAPWSLVNPSSNSCPW